MVKHSVSRLSYLFAHLHLLSSHSFSSSIFSLLLSDSSHRCFSMCPYCRKFEVWLLNFLRLHLPQPIPGYWSYKPITLRIQGPTLNCLLPWMPPLQSMMVPSRCKDGPNLGFYIPDMEHIWDLFPTFPAMIASSSSFNAVFFCSHRLSVFLPWSFI